MWSDDKGTQEGERRWQQQVGKWSQQSKRRESRLFTLLHTTPAKATLCDSSTRDSQEVGLRAPGRTLFGSAQAFDQVRRDHGALAQLACG